MSFMAMPLRVLKEEIFRDVFRTVKPLQGSYRLISQFFNDFSSKLVFSPTFRMKKPLYSLTLVLNKY